MMDEFEAAPSKGGRGRGGFRRVGTSMAVVALCLHAPFAWLLLMNYPWGGGYRLSWLGMWPILPGFLAGIPPGLLLYHRHLPHESLTMGATTVLLMAGLTWLGSPGRGRLGAAAGVALAISVPSSIIAYRVFWA